MNDVLALLEDLADEARPQAMPGAASLRRGAERRSRRTQLGWAAVAAAAVAAVAVGAVATHPKATEEPANPLPKLTDAMLPDRLTAPDVPATWTTDLSQGGRFAVNAVAYHGGTWLALGETAPEGQSTHSHSVGWVSRDGQHWTRTTVPDGLGHGDGGVVGTADGFLATGEHRDYPYAWTSTDGTTWSRADLTDNLNDYQPYATSKGLYVAGEAYAYGTNLWRSSDHGRTWVLVEDNLEFNTLPTVDGRREDLMPVVQWIGEKNGTLVAGGTGYSWGDDGGAKAALVYTSSDGEHWTEHFRPFTSQHDRATWADRAGGYRSTHDEDHYAVVRGDGQVAVWQPPSE